MGQAHWMIFSLNRPILYNFILFLWAFRFGLFRAQISLIEILFALLKWSPKTRPHYQPSGGGSIE